MKRSDHIRLFAEEIWKWYAVHRRDLPWRRDLSLPNANARAYRILVSEIMLQQTQVSRVIGAYRSFLERFPTMEHLERASTKDVLLAWRGMGYNSRALRLRDAARSLVHAGGVFPCEMYALLELPGLGPYTAAAIRNFAFNLPTPCLDTNIRRILHRSFIGPENADGTWKKNDAYLLKLAAEVLLIALACKLETRKPANLQTKSAAEWHAALMDFGSLVCTKRNPKWENCPLTKHGLMKAAYKLPVRTDVRPGGKTKNYKLRDSKKEPGRFVGSTYIPNRIFRGRVIDELRDEGNGLTLEQLGQRVCLDWSPKEHRQWMQEILHKLRDDSLVAARGKKFVLAE